MIMNGKNYSEEITTTRQTGGLLLAYKAKGLKPTILT